MGLLQTLGQGQGYLKAGFLGFPKSGKTYTATLLAIGVRKLFKLDTPIAMFDTEGGSEYVAPMVASATGKPLMGIRSRSFDDLVAMTKECETQASVLIVDSMTHIWRELCAAYMKGLNETLKARGKQTRNRFELADIMAIKDLWAVWPDLYLNSKLHIIICGRAGFEWEMVENEDTGKKELTKTGVKMKVESEFGFEPSLLVQMERDQIVDDGKTTILHAATVIGDRFGLIDGKQCNNPDFDFFKPHVAALNPGVHAPIDTEVKTKVNIDDQGNTDWQHEKRQRAIFCEEIQGVLVDRWPGATAAEKKAKSDAIEATFNTRSWTKVESLNSTLLKEGLDRLRALVDERNEVGV